MSENIFRKVLTDKCRHPLERRSYFPDIQQLADPISAYRHPNDCTVAYMDPRPACLGVNLNRAKNPPPGDIVFWRGMSRLTDIELGY